LEELAIAELEGKRRTNKDPANDFDGMPDRRLFCLDVDKYAAFSSRLDQTSPAGPALQANAATAIVDG
jgi:hypothetical protein